MTRESTVICAILGISVLGIAVLPVEVRGQGAAASGSSTNTDGLLTVHGAVRDVAGRSLEGVQLQVRPHGGRATQSGPQGQFEIAWHHYDWVQAAYLVAWHAGRKLAIATPVSDETGELDLTLQPAATLSGTVADPSGRGIANAEIRVALHAANWGSPLEHCSTRTNAQGRFVIETLPPDNRYSVTARADGYGDARTRVDVGETGDVGTLTLRVADVSVTGRVVDVDGRPMPGVHVYCNNEGQPRASAETDATGRFTLEPVCADEIRIFAEVRIEGREIAGRVATEGGASDITVVISEGPSVTRYIRTKSYEEILESGPFVAGVVLDESGAPVADVPLGVRCIKRRVAEGKFSWSFSDYARLGDVTNGQGRFIIALEEDAEYSLRFSPRHQAAIIVYDVPSGTKDLRVTLPQGATVTGRVVRMERGEKTPVPGVEVELEQTSRTSYMHLGFDRDRTVQTDTEGRFRFEHVRTKMRPIESMQRQEWEYTPRLWRVLNGDTSETVLFEDGADVVDVELVVRPDPADAAPLQGKSLPEFYGITFDRPMERAQGRKLLLCFFDMNQRPSRHAVRQLARRRQSLADQGVVIAAIQTVAADADSLATWAKESDIDLPIGAIQSDGQEIRYTFAVRSLPWLILTDTKHTVTAEGFTLSQLDEQLAQAEASQP